MCELCKGAAPVDSPVVYADRAGYNKQWHPGCFTCAQCAEPLVDLIYFWKDGAPWCGRHYCQSLRPRCSGCDEVRRKNQGGWALSWCPPGSLRVGQCLALRTSGHQGGPWLGHEQHSLTQDRMRCHHHHKGSGSGDGGMDHQSRSCCLPHSLQSGGPQGFLLRQDLPLAGTWAILGCWEPCSVGPADHS